MAKKVSFAARSGRKMHAVERAQAKIEFLRHLATLGVVEKACDAAEISRSAPYEWRRVDLEFAADLAAVQGALTIRRLERQPPRGPYKVAPDLSKASDRELLTIARSRAQQIKRRLKIGTSTRQDPTSGGKPADFTAREEVSRADSPTAGQEQSYETPENDFELKLSSEQKYFLAEYVANFGYVLAACRASGVSQTTFDKWRERDADFRSALRDAEEDITDRFLADLRRRGVDGVDVPVMRKGKPIVYWVNQAGRVVRKGTPGSHPINKTVKRYSTKALILLLQWREPTIYGKKGGQDKSLGR